MKAKRWDKNWPPESIEIWVLDWYRSTNQTVLFVKPPKTSGGNPPIVQCHWLFCCGSCFRADAEKVSFFHRSGKSCCFLGRLNVWPRLCLYLWLLLLYYILWLYLWLRVLVCFRCFLCLSFILCVFLLFFWLFVCLLFLLLPVAFLLLLLLLSFLFILCFVIIVIVVFAVFVVIRYNSFFIPACLPLT